MRCSSQGPDSAKCPRTLPLQLLASFCGYSSVPGRATEALQPFHCVFKSLLDLPLTETVQAHVHVIPIGNIKVTGAPINLHAGPLQYSFLLKSDLHNPI